MATAPTVTASRACAAGVSLAGRYDLAVPHRLVFGSDALAILPAALVLSFLRIDRLV